MSADLASGDAGDEHVDDIDVAGATRYLRVAVDVPSDKRDDAYLYSCPPTLGARVGHRVSVPFGPRTALGVVVGEASDEEVETTLATSGIGKIREIRGILDDPSLGPALLPYQVALARDMATRYLAPFVECLKVIMPPHLRTAKTSTAPRARRVRADTTASIVTGPRLTPDQKVAVDAVLPAVREGQARTFLLHGVTGSGKTEVYLQLMEEARRLGKGAILLVPEIALTPQTQERVMARLGEGVAVIHSRLSPGERARTWERIRRGDATMVVGSRSALFAPLARPGVLLIDEEDSWSYKQDKVPRYHAAVIAEKLAELVGVPLVMGSATPRLETFYRGHGHGIELLTLATRPLQRPLPQIEVVDMRAELAAGNKSPLSLRLSDEISRVAKRGGQMILFMNRRGFSPIVLCRGCGETLMCPHCSVSLVLHESHGRVACHFCGTQVRFTGICPGCGSSAIRGVGAGTERIEKEVARAFPSLRLLRMDRDTVTHRDAYWEMYETFRRGDADCLIGTQMVAKGLDIAGVELVGIVNADTSLRFPDYRAGEMTFSLLTQVAGRAGRGDVAGSVVLQTYSPDHYAITHARTHDYLGFAHEEIRVRHRFNFPPYGRLVTCLYSHAQDESARKEAGDVVTRLREKVTEYPGIEVLGPSPAFISKARDLFRWQCIIRGVEIERVFQDLPTTRGWVIDVDPGP